MLYNETMEETYSPATLQFNLAYQDFWAEGAREVVFDVQRETGSGDVPVIDAVFNHVY